MNATSKTISLHREICFSEKDTHRELVCFEYVSRSVQSVLMMDLSMKSANGTGNTNISVPNIIFLQAIEFSG